MNELQQKLARRRNLNGEGDSAQGPAPLPASAGATPAVVLPPRIPPVVPTPNRGYSSAAASHRNSISSVVPSAGCSPNSNGESEVADDEWGDEPTSSASTVVKLATINEKVNTVCAVNDTETVEVAVTSAGDAAEDETTAIAAAAAAKKAEDEAAKKAEDEAAAIAAAAAAAAKKAEDDAAAIAAAAAAKKAEDEAAAIAAAAVAKKAEDDAVAIAAAAAAKKAEDEAAAIAAAAVAKKAEDEAAVVVLFSGEKTDAETIPISEKAVERLASLSVIAEPVVVVDELKEFQSFLEDDFLVDPAGAIRAASTSSAASVALPSSSPIASASAAARLLLVEARSGAAALGRTFSSGSSAGAGGRIKSFDLFAADDGEDDGSADVDFLMDSAELTELTKSNTRLKSQISQLQTELNQKQGSIVSLIAENVRLKEESVALSAQLQKVNSSSGVPVGKPLAVVQPKAVKIEESGLFSLPSSHGSLDTVMPADLGSTLLASDTEVHGSGAGVSSSSGLTGAADVNKRLKIQFAKLQDDLAVKEQQLIKLSTEGNQQKRAIGILKARLARTVVVPSLYSNRPVNIPAATLTPAKAPETNKNSVLKSAKKLGFDQSKLSEAIFSMQEDELFSSRTRSAGSRRESRIDSDGGIGSVGSGVSAADDAAADILFSSPNKKTGSGTHGTYSSGGKVSAVGNDMSHLLSRSCLMDMNNAHTGTRASELSHQLNRHGLFDDSNSTAGDDGDEFDSASASASASASGSNVSDKTGGPLKAMFRDYDAPSHAAAVLSRSKYSTKHLNFDQFVDLLLTEENKDLSNAIKKFIMETLGPHGDGTGPSEAELEEIQVKHETYKFVGPANLPKRYADFTEDIIDYMGKQERWQHIIEDEDELMVIQNHLETYIVSFLADLAFTAVTDSDADEKLLHRMRLLSTFIEPEVLGINPAVRNDMVWAMAQDSLRKMHSLKMPAEKVACVVKCASILFRSLNLARVNTEAINSSGASAGVDPLSAPGADDFLPVFIYVVLKSNVSKLYSNCEFIQHFLNSSQLRSQSGYFFISLRSAMEFIMNLDAESINMDPTEFDRKMAEAEHLVK